MALITNPKIGYRSFAGFSLLFDNPKEEENYLLHAGKLDLINCQTVSLPFLSACGKGMHAIGDEVWEQHGMLPLSQRSWHVTLWDGINVANIHTLDEPYREPAQQLMVGMPFSIRSGNDMIRDAANSSLANWRGDIRYCYDRLEIINDYVLVALLKPVDENSVAVQRSLEDQRSELSRLYDAHYGLPIAGSFMPHMTMGYFLRNDEGRRSLDFVSLWNDKMRESLADQNNPTIEFTSAGLYGFTDMEHFYRTKPVA